MTANLSIFPWFIILIILLNFYSFKYQPMPKSISTSQLGSILCDCSYKIDEICNTFPISIISISYSFRQCSKYVTELIDFNQVCRFLSNKFCSSDHYAYIDRYVSFIDTWRNLVYFCRLLQFKTLFMFSVRKGLFLWIIFTTSWQKEVLDCHFCFDQSKSTGVVLYIIICIDRYAFLYNSYAESIDFKILISVVHLYFHTTIFL